ncbi:MAG: LysE family translocator [Alphaproteobacteria bacterium]|nr:MAG: LysE family translocator [Alphaproteobacteria bacterium]
MSVSLGDLALYAGALLVLFLTPGPVWLALIARGLAGGFGAVWPLALGVVVGDVLWPALALLGVGALASQSAAALGLMRWVAVAMFAVMGLRLWRRAGAPLEVPGRLTAPGTAAGFGAGVAVILGNPKAILFYMGILPGFFDLTALGGTDIAAICALSAAVPLFGNLVLGLLLGRVRGLLASPRARGRLERVAAALMLVVAAVIAAG